MKSYIVYRKEVCEILKEENGIYELVPISDDSIKYHIPKDSQVLRKIISKEEMEELLDLIPSIEVIPSKDKTLENVYKELLAHGKHEDLIKVIKTAYLRNQARLLNNKKISDKDDEYLKRAEKYLCDEFSVILNMNFEDTKNFVINKVKEVNV